MNPSVKQKLIAYSVGFFVALMVIILLGHLYYWTLTGNMVADNRIIAAGFVFITCAELWMVRACVEESELRNAQEKEIKYLAYIQSDIIEDELGDEWHISER